MAYIKSTYSKSEENRVNFIRTSSLNRYFLCHYCDRKFVKRDDIQQHVITCLITRTCKWCKLVFKNRGNLATHAYYMHNDKSVKSKKGQAITCEVCGKSFGNSGGLKYHIRRAHFNLVAKIPYYDEKEINQVWFEKVLNSDSIVEMKKAGHNMLLLRKLNDDEQVRVQESKILLDLTSMYPTGNRVTLTKCDICDIELLERDYKKHYDEKHGEVKKHHCNNCDKTFKRSYFFVRHSCHKTGRRKRRPKLQISKVESLAPIPV